ncbi:hypothetical protein HDA35_003432 [Micromonospora purpureochromogenes]|uniref:DUF2752 domain-containing protein n=1 Tax=Micromonospora purpureochromogenes TaxID=47872 RepID=A0ABX2RMY7_9ACTN|nr:DUF2752 domain-containing protein [Micromonospora purpureochromogenes]NYF57601.1 hypothetical protein [Micromonospora purpureochromogenes]
MTSVDGSAGQPGQQVSDTSAPQAAPPGAVAAPHVDAAPPGEVPRGAGVAPGAGDPHGHAEGAWAHDGASAAWPPGAYQQVEPDRLTRFVLRVHARSPRWAAPLAALGCVGIGMAYALVSDPTRSDPDAAPSCLLKLTTGLDCPGCGGTRALWYVLHGDLPAAARHHFLFVFALPFLAYLFVAWAGQQAFGWRLPELRISSPVIAGFLAVWLAFSVARNLPWAPFTALYV